MFWKLENEFFQFGADHYCKFTSLFVLCLKTSFTFFKEFEKKLDYKFQYNQGTKKNKGIKFSTKSASNMSSLKR